MRSVSIIILSLLILTACNHTKNDSDASGSFEATEYIISSEVGGIIKEFKIEEGMVLKQGIYVGYIDSTQLALKKKQLEKQIRSTLTTRPNISSQTAALEVQLKTAEKERNRVENLVKADAATQKQLDDANSMIDVIKKQIDAQRSALGITSEGITAQTDPLQVQIEQLNDQLSRSRIINPVNGTVLTKYAEANESTMPGKALYKIADVSTLFLRAYITGAQLPQIKTGQKVKVMVDADADSYKNYDGEITWISDKAEFIPKTIQTKEERANMVYAIKIKVKNDGYLKIGMYAEVKF